VSFHHFHVYFQYYVSSSTQVLTLLSCPRLFPLCILCLLFPNWLDLCQLSSHLQLTVLNIEARV
jgi:hypothetical protein